MCPYVWDDAYVRCSGTVRVRERGRRHRLLALGHFTHGDDGDDFNVPLALTLLGYHRWSGRHGATLATVILRLTAEQTPKRPFNWTVRVPHRE